MSQVKKWVRGWTRGVLTILLLLVVAAGARAAFRAVPTGVISPTGVGATYTVGQVVMVDIDWCADPDSLDLNSFVATVDRQDGSQDNVSSAFTNGHGLVVDCTIGARSDGPVTLEKGNNSFWAQIRDENQLPGQVSATYFVPFDSVVVTTSPSSVSKGEQTTGHTQTFTVTP